MASRFNLRVSGREEGWKGIMYHHSSGNTRKWSNKNVIQISANFKAFENTYIHPLVAKWSVTLHIFFLHPTIKAIDLFSWGSPHEHLETQLAITRPSTHQRFHSGQECQTFAQDLWMECLSNPVANKYHYSKQFSFKIENQLWERSCLPQI